MLPCRWAHSIQAFIKYFYELGLTGLRLSVTNFSSKFSKILQLTCHHCFQPGILRTRVSERMEHKNAEACVANTAAQRVSVLLFPKCRVANGSSCPAREHFSSPPHHPPPQSLHLDVACDIFLLRGCEQNGCVTSWLR